jgi:mono/diheme cytochrome c family protein
MLTRRRLLELGLALPVPFVLAACGGGSSEATPTEPRETTTGTTTTGTTGTTTTGGQQQGNATAGKQVFATAGCTGCHTLADAGSNGTVGPNLDDANVTAEQAAEQIRNGGGGMPAFGDRLSDQEIADVAAFVTQGQ